MNPEIPIRWTWGRLQRARKAALLEESISADAKNFPELQIKSVGELRSILTSTPASREKLRAALREGAIDLRGEIADCLNDARLLRSNSG